MNDLVVPAGMWDESDTAVLSTWLYRDGEAVVAGAVVAEIMVSKSSFDLAARVSGVLRIAVADESEVRPGQVVGTVA